MHMMSKDGSVPSPHIMAWEITRSCNLACAHCRASALCGPYPGELTTQECFRVVDEITQIGRPIVILTGGEPLMRPDVFEVAEYAMSKGLRAVMSPNGTLITDEVAQKMKAIGIPRISVSLDFPTAELHDKFRGQPGAFEGALRGIQAALRNGVEVQVNTTITKLNAQYLDEMLKAAIDVGAVAFFPFMLVPTGRGKELEAEELSPADYEETLNWIYERQKELGDKIFFKPTDAPHYWRVLRQRNKIARAEGEGLPHPHATAHPRSTGGMQAMTRGCLAGSGFFFISHVGRVQGCGYLDVDAGNVKEQSLVDIWNNSKVFRDLRDLSLLKGKCGICEYQNVCGGCRARAYEATGDYLQAEPYCIYEPKGIRPSSGHSCGGCRAGM